VRELALSTGSQLCDTSLFAAGLFRSEAVACRVSGAPDPLFAVFVLPLGARLLFFLVFGCARFPQLITTSMSSSGAAFPICLASLPSADVSLRKPLCISTRIVDWFARFLSFGFLLLANVRNCERLSALLLLGVIKSLATSVSNLAFCEFLLVSRTVFGLSHLYLAASVC